VTEGDRTTCGRSPSRISDLRTHVDTGFATVERGFTEMRGKFDAAASWQQSGFRS